MSPEPRVQPSWSFLTRSWVKVTAADWHKLGCRRWINLRRHTEQKGVSLSRMRQLREGWKMPQEKLIDPPAHVPTRSHGPSVELRGGEQPPPPPTVSAQSAVGMDVEGSTRSRHLRVSF